VIGADGDRKFCEGCGKYSATTEERVVLCFDECRCEDDTDLCDPCFEATERERVKREAKWDKEEER
jgi:hypothetical protein